ncbi:MAG: response regulator [Deltaproteobacteria bacterium]|nr:response regulator [Deltaproteobacteria bacterium]NCP02819.1 response regulator [Deltaproteobacteria bacterium]NCP78401.1 response regulator [Desulfuromonadales bacterium]
MERRILIVDDEESIRESLKDFLEDFDFQVAAAASAEAALQLLQEQPIDILVADLRLPGISGDTLIVKAHELYPSMQYVILTGSVGYLFSEKLQAVGILPRHIMQKPLFDLMLLVETLEDILQHSA